LWRGARAVPRFDFVVLSRGGPAGRFTAREEPMMRRNPRSSPRSGGPSRAPAAALVAAGAIAMAACVSSGRYTQVEQERDLLAARNAALENQVAEAKASGDSLTQEKAMLAQERGALVTEKLLLEAKLSELQTQESALGSKLKEREEEARRLQSTYDGLVADLKKELEAGQVQVQQLRDGLRVNVSQDILFESGSAELDKDGTEVLEKVAGQLQKSPHQVLVIGHTDNKPIGTTLVKRYPTNWELAGARASSVVRLFAQAGLPARRMQAVSVADVQPVADNSSSEGRARNRRIEIRLRPVPAED
jgi:chemotaxis protein MotB